MRIALRLIVSLIFVAVLVAALFSFYQVQSERDRLTDELERRAVVLAESLEDPVKELLQSNSSEKLKSLVERFGNRQRLVGTAVYDNQGVILAASSGLSSKIPQSLSQVNESIEEDQWESGLRNIGGKTTYVYALPLYQEGNAVGVLVLFHDASFIDARLNEIWRNNFMRLFTLSVLIILTTVIVVRWSITGPIDQIAEGLRGLRMGKTTRPVDLPKGDVLGPLATEVTYLAKSLSLARATAEQEAQLRIKAESVWTVWTAERLKEFMRLELKGKKLFVISNREPYMHVKQGRTVEYIVPAGGLVTAMEPVLRACKGVWIAHGSGDADMETADKKGKLHVPPEEPLYILKRVWLTKEEEEGYYYGFSNEGIWPLCHITHVRPIFRLNDWIHYQKVNEKFAEALLEEVESEEEPLVLIQDYHLALLPLLIKSRRPDARIAIFWHIPWPNPEVFGICPWKREILLGLLGAKLIGFHTQFYCNNFLETIDRVLESKIKWDEFSVEHRGHFAWVRPFPISVAFPSLQNETVDVQAVNRQNLLKEIDVSSRFLAVGVDRIDYTKGIIEKFKAVERFLEKYPEFIGEFTFVQLGPPSRIHIKRYRDLIAEIEETADKINWRFQTKNWKPVVFLKAHHSREKINCFYKAADLCMVTSLHDGMNLVSKEFVASREDEDGVLILSEFAGASRELRDALIVNPYDTEAMAECIRLALTMTKDERRDRMKRMRAVVKERNVYYWAANLISTLYKLPSQSKRG